MQLPQYMSTKHTALRCLSWKKERSWFPHEEKKKEQIKSKVLKNEKITKYQSGNQ